MNIIEQLFPKGAPDWEACLHAFPQLEFAKTTPQSPIHHAEGDVWTHTKMVVEELLAQQSFQVLSPEHQRVAFMAALLHDISKYSTTVIDPDTGKISQPGHSEKGAVDARIALWKHGVPWETREHICRIIRVHQKPFWVLSENRKYLTPEFTIRELSHQLNMEVLSCVAEADIRGRIAPDVKDVLDNIDLFRMMAQDEDCYTKPKVFVDDHTALKYWRGANVHPDYPLFWEGGSDVIVMSGLPASGKNFWVEKNHPDLPVISFDDAREELGLKHGQNDGAAAHLAVDNAKVLLRKKEPFIWNATHLTTQMRGKTLDLLFNYDARVTVVHMEKPLEELLSRNNKRDSSLSNKTLEGMLFKWQAPLPTEAHVVKYLD